MAGLNKVMLIGHLGADPEVRAVTGGEVANFRLATSETWKDKNGERQERTQWHNITCWNEHLTPIIDKYLRKGSKVYVEGQLEHRSYEDKDGNKRFATEVVLRFNAVLQMLDSKDEGERRGGGRERDDDRGNRGGGRGRDDDRGGRGRDDDRRRDDPPARTARRGADDDDRPSRSAGRVQTGSRDRDTGDYGTREAGTSGRSRRTADAIDDEIPF